MPQIIFLVYHSRSGSTFLSSVLDSFPDIGVTLESNFMLNLLLSKRRIRQAASADVVYELLMQYDRFKNLDIQREIFREKLGNCSGYSIERVVYSILDTYFAREKPDCKVWVVKDGSNGYLINQIAREMPTAKFVHLIRDGRAVLSSQNRTVRPYSTRERMARDSVTVARLWRNLIRRVDAYTGQNPNRCVEIRYEDMVSDVEQHISILRCFFGVEYAVRTSQARNYYDKLPSEEKAIHQLVSGPPIRERIDAWKSDLREEDRLLFEFLAGPSLRKHGYEIEKSAESKNIQLLLSYLQGQFLRVIDWGRLVAKPKQIKKIVGIKFARWKDN